MDSPVSKEKYYPSIHLDSGLIPELKSVEIGDEVELCFKCTIQSMRMDERESSMELELTGGAVYDVSKKKDGGEKKSEPSKNSADEALEKLSMSKDHS